MKRFVRADMQCADCHIAAGTQLRGGSFVGTYARFPQWNKRAHRVIALQDRIAECFLYSMNGRAPAYNSKPMIALVAYVAWLSRGTPIGAKQPASDRYIEPLPTASPDAARGAASLCGELRELSRRPRAGNLRDLPAALGRPLLQRRRRHGAHRSDDRLHPLQHAEERTGHALARSGLRRCGIRAEPSASAFSKECSRVDASPSSQVLLAAGNVVGPGTS